MEALKSFLGSSFRWHLAVGAIVRLVLIIYASYHDEAYDVPYTDVDYKVFTDAARYVVSGNSPYKRHTYRYSPVIAYLMTPNILIHPDFGKVLFSLFDLFVAVAVKRLVEFHVRGLKDKESVSKISKYCSLFWLYNPLSIAISTRGNADSFPCFLIVLSMLFLQSKIVRGLKKYVISGFLLGISIHLRLYPLAFSFPMYLSLGEYSITRSTPLKEGLLSLIPNKKQVLLAFSCLVSLGCLTWLMYHLYGYEFLFETYIYHGIRKDTRHNFSVLFYYQYLSANDLAFDFVKMISLIFEFITLFALSLTFGCDARTLPFAMFSQALVLVAYNSVMTSQYFVWFLSLLPLVVHNLKVRPKQGVLMTITWFMAQGFWLFYAYFLEFLGQQVFMYIWFAGIVFFCTNVYILVTLVNSYSSGYAFGYSNQLPYKRKLK